MSATVFSLPVPLILLIHLHIIQYPHANKPEYDQNIFNPRVRGVRDRTKTMEDVCYFLVSRIDNGRKVLPTYPCSQPSETTAFRTSLAKFLEGLRHSSVFPSSAKSKPTGGEEHGAWWWKDVIVRKSLLEECSGEKFERLILALSTHVLMVGSRIKAEPTQSQNLLRSQPRVYSTRLGEFQVSYNTWTRTAARLVQRQRDLSTLQENILNVAPTRHAQLSTEKLLSLSRSKLRDLLAGWSEPALIFCIELAALERTDDVSSGGSTAVEQVPQTPPAPLPIAAAHHPELLRKLRRRIFSSDNSVESQMTNSTQSRAAIALSGRIDAEERMLQALKAACARTRKTAAGLRPHLDRATKRTSTLRPINMNLWQDTHPIKIDLMPQLTDAAFTAAGLSVPGSRVLIQSRVDDIRRTLLPKYPDIPGAPARQKAAPRTPKRAARELKTETPPETVKPQRHYRAAVDDDPGTDHTPRRTYGVEEDPFEDEGPSMSVRDLLLQADTTCFDMLSDGREFEDQSILWE
ncbi:hypothetical protein FB45DRAFT_889291 [Roridomyces roridus]|uniref:HAUS augmin-like complex subunit 6 N-terminal domain-containing protein n=1 Tax=Roridomyces roridus TaxID=1738132 RepID=A0AAD7CKC5_9AGAR|nr:hypothetical protein FB45DRAFT_889291 [Roridomyces roridus]